MWIITHIHSGKKTYLLPEVGTYKIGGRVGSDIALCGDSSISRIHAAFHVTDSSLKLEDTGSKYGTYYNENIDSKKRLPQGKCTELKEGDRVLFGALKNEWLISKSNITTMVSSLTAAHSSEVKSLLDSLGGRIISKWEPSCTHLTMSEITVTLKVLHALIEKIPIVSCEYWKDYHKQVLEKKEPPQTGGYMPKKSASLSSAIDDKHLTFNDKRKTLFAGKTFIFMSKKHLDMYAPIVVKAGGQCKDLKSNVHKSFLLQKNVIVVQYVPSTQSQSSQTINTISDYLEASSLRTIPEYEIGLAIVCCTTETYCNPSYNTISNILPVSAKKSPCIGTIFAENTGSQKSQFTLDFPSVEVPDSDDVVGQTTSSKPLQSENSGRNASESEVFSIKDVYNSGGASEIPDSDSSCRSKRKRDASDEKSSNLHVAKKKNNSIPDTFSGNLVISEASSSESEPSTSKDKRKMNGNDNRPAKRVHLSSPFDSDDGDLVTISEETAISSNATKSPIVPEPPVATPPMQKKSAPRTSNKYSGFLQKSQIVQTQQEPPEPAAAEQPTSGPVNRGRIARITDSDSDNEDDLFNFGSSPKRARNAEDENSDDELFAFGGRPSEDTVDRAAVNNDDDLPPTQPFVPLNKLPVKDTRPRIKVVPIKAAPDRWMSKLSALQIKSEMEAEVKTEVKDEEDLKRDEWIDSIRGGFEVRVRKMVLSSKKSCSTLHASTDSTLNGTKNFKAFVKKRNYKPQTVIIRTVPMVVPPMR